MRRADAIRAFLETLLHQLDSFRELIVDWLNEHAPPGRVIGNSVVAHFEVEFTKRCREYIEQIDRLLTLAIGELKKRSDIGAEWKKTLRRRHATHLNLLQDRTKDSIALLKSRIAGQLVTHVLPSNLGEKNHARRTGVALRQWLAETQGEETAPRASADETKPTGPQWLSLAQAETLSGINRGTISRAVDAGEIKSNGKTGKGNRKVDSVDFNRWHLERASRPEQTESDKQVEKQFDAKGDGKRNKR